MPMFRLMWLCFLLEGVEIWGSETCCFLRIWEGGRMEHVRVSFFFFACEFVFLC